MKDLRMSIKINKPVEEVFAYATDSKNTPTWYPSIKEEIPSSPIFKLGTKIKNRGEKTDLWNYYEITNFEQDKTFTLSQLGTSYHVKYTFTKTEDGTELEYYEWVDYGELEEPANVYNLELLKTELEKSKYSVGDNNERAGNAKHN